MLWYRMDPSKHFNQFASSQAAAPRARSPFPHPQQHVQPSSRTQPVQQHHPQVSLTSQSHELVHQMSGVQLRDNTHTPVTPHSVPYLNGNLSPGSGSSRQGQIGTRGLQRPGLMPPRAPQMGRPPLFPVPGREYGAMNGQQPRTAHSWQQQQLSPSLMGSFQSSGQEPFHSSSVAQQPIQQQPAVQLQQQFRELSAEDLPDPIQVISIFKFQSENFKLISHFYRLC